MSPKQRLQRGPQLGWTHAQCGAVGLSHQDAQKRLRPCSSVILWRGPQPSAPLEPRLPERPDVLGSRTLDPRTDPRVQSSCSSTDDAQTHVTNHVPYRASLLPRTRNPMPPTRVSCAFLGRRPGTVATYQLPKATKKKVPLLFFVSGRSAKLVELCVVDF